MGRTSALRPSVANPSQGRRCRRFRPVYHLAFVIYSNVHTQPTAAAAASGRPRLRTRRSRTNSWFLFAVALIANQLASQDAHTFRTGLRAIIQAQAADWPKAKEQLTALINQHKDSDYVRHARTELVELDRRLTFESGYAVPSLQSLVSGKIATYKLKTGRIKLIYTPETLGDFLDPNKPKPPRPEKKRPSRPGILELTLPKFPMRDRVNPYRPRIHPARFRSCKIEISGASYGKTELLTGIDANGAYRTIAGVPLGGYSWTPTYVIQRRGTDSTELFVEDWQTKRHLSEAKQRKPKDVKMKWPMQSGKPYTVRIDMAPKSLKLRINRRSITQQRWSTPLVGGVGFLDDNFKKLTIEGQIEPAWIDGLFDNHRQAAREAHDERYIAKAELPAWIFTAPKAITAGTQRWYPGTERPKEMESIREVLDDLSKGRGKRVLIRLVFWKDGYVPSIVKQYLESYAHMVDGSPSKALKLGKSVLAADPEFCNQHLVVGYALMSLGQFEAACEEFRFVIQKQPAHPNAPCDLAQALLRMRQPEQARTVLEDAIARGLSSDKVQSMRRRAQRILRGPDFGDRFTVTTPHYEITSDIDQATCKSSGEVLEAALAYYCTMLGNVRTRFAHGQRFRVFLFATEQGYKRYLEGLDLEIPIHTAGLYSPALQQLLIWNLPSRTNMLRTIRHEGFHQYFDLLADDAPVWLNEGLAEYFEVSRFRAGKPSAGIVQPKHVRSLRLIRSRNSLESFTKIMPQEFYGPGASLHYSQSWAFVRYLRRGTPSVRAIFDRLVKSLANGERREVALAKAFDGVDMERLSKGFWESVGKLRAK